MRQNLTIDSSQRSATKKEQKNTPLRKQVAFRKGVQVKVYFLFDSKNQAHTSLVKRNEISVCQRSLEASLIAANIGESRAIK